GLEPARLSAHDPKSCSSASSDTSPQPAIIAHENDLPQPLRECLADPLHGVDLDAIDAHFPVQVGSGREACIANRADLLAPGHRLPRFNEYAGLVPVAGVNAPAMV